MKLSDVYTKPLKEVIEELELTKTEIYSDEDGNVKAIELKYSKKIQESNPGPRNNPWT